MVTSTPELRQKSKKQLDVQTDAGDDQTRCVSTKVTSGERNSTATGSPEKPNRGLAAVASVDSVDNSVGMKRLDCRGRPFYESVHVKASHSLLSHNTAAVNLRGLLNLLVIVVVAQNGRLVIENLLKYGLLVKFIPTMDTARALAGQWPMVVAFLVMNIAIVGSYATERYLTASQSPLTDSFQMWFIKASLCFAMILIPHQAVQCHTSDPLSASILLLFALTWCIKLISFHHYLYDLRLALHMNEKLDGACAEEVELAHQFPQCLTLKHMFTYMSMPTLCFQLHYPRTPRIMGYRVLRSVAEVLIKLIFIKIIIEQYMMKIVQNTFIKIHLKEMSTIRIIALLAERILKLSIPSVLVWLLMFFSLFHDWLNILAELTRFADRSFYLDWWNAASFGEYWRKWNLPIHNFCQRHMNKPLLRRGTPRFIASHIVFIVSAVAHEYLVVAPLGIGWVGIAFSAFILQIPLIYITNAKIFRKHETLGNMVFWTCFCFTGQPVAVIIYYFLWSAQQQQTETIEFRNDLLDMIYPKKW